VKPAAAGVFTWNALVSFEVPPSGFVTTTSRSPVAAAALSTTVRCWPVPSGITDVTMMPLAAVVVPALKNCTVAPV